MIKTLPVADRGSLVNRVKNKLLRIAIRTLRAPYFYPDPKSPLDWGIFGSEKIRGRIVDI